jgi:hypothetical protein
MTDGETLRSQIISKPGFYSPWLHLAAPTAVGVIVTALCARALHAVTPLEWLFALGVFVFSNAVEWRAHKNMLHKRFAPLGLLYDRHTPIHHRIYVAGDMEMRNLREFRIVLMPAYAVLAILLVTAPPALIAWWLGFHNLAALYWMVTTLYAVLYEWMHLSYHLPDRMLVGPLRAVRFLRQHHESHHDPELMQHWNFNITLPLWDLVMRTYRRPTPR